MSFNLKKTISEYVNIHLTFTNTQEIIATVRESNENTTI